MIEILNAFTARTIWSRHHLIFDIGGVRIWMHWASVIDWGTNIYIGIKLISPLFTHLTQFEFAENEIPQKCINMHWREKSQKWGLTPNSKYLSQNIFWHWKFQFQFLGADSLMGGALDIWYFFFSHKSIFMMWTD